MLDNWYPAWSRESFRGTAFIQAQGYLVTWCEATVSDSPAAPGRKKPVLLSSAKPHVSIFFLSAAIIATAWSRPGSCRPVSSGDHGDVWKPENPCREISGVTPALQRSKLFPMWQCLGTASLSGWQHYPEDSVAELPTIPKLLRTTSEKGTTRKARQASSRHTFAQEAKAL